MRSNTLGRVLKGSLTVLALAVVGIGEAAAQAEPRCPRAYELPRNVTAVTDTNSSVRNATRILTLSSPTAPKPSATDLQDVYNSCQRELSPKSKQVSVPALLCMGRAQIAMADLGDSERNSFEAECALNAAKTLLDRRPDAQLAAEVGLARGDLMMAWLARPGATRTRAQLLNDAIAGYTAAVQAPSYDRYMALGRAQLEANQSIQAVASFKAAYNQDRTKSAEFAKSVLAVAEQKLTTLPADPAARAEALRQVQPVLIEAQSALPKSISINSALAQTYFLQDKSDLTRDTIGRILSPTAPSAALDAVNDIPVGGKNYLAQALYYRSVIAARRSPTERTVLPDAQAAAAGGSEREYRRQACLAFIAAGGEAMKGEQMSQCEIDGTAEGELLRGMLLLRRAQYLNPGTISQTPKRKKYEDVIGEASKAFARGLTQLGTAPETPIVWPDYTATASLRDALNYGRSIAWQCQSPIGTRDPYDLDANLRGRARIFFTRYNALNCSAS